MDSTGQTIDFLLAAKRDTAAAKRFFEKVFSSSSNPIPRVINVDKNPAYPAAVEALKVEVLSSAEFFCASASISTWTLYLISLFPNFAMNQKINFSFPSDFQFEE